MRRKSPRKGTRGGAISNYRPGPPKGPHVGRAKRDIAKVPASENAPFWATTPLQEQRETVLLLGIVTPNHNRLRVVSESSLLAFPERIPQLHIPHTIRLRPLLELHDSVGEVGNKVSGPLASNVVRVLLRKKDGRQQMAVLEHYPQVHEESALREGVGAFIREIAEFRVIAIFQETRLPPVGRAPPLRPLRPRKT